MEELLLGILKRKEAELAKLLEESRGLSPEQIFHYNVLFDSLDPNDQLRKELVEVASFKGLAILRGFEIQKLSALRGENARLLQRVAELERQNGAFKDAENARLKERVEKFESKERLEELEKMVRLQSERYLDVLKLQNQRKDHARNEADRLYAQAIDSLREALKKGNVTDEVQSLLIEPIEIFTTQMRLLVEDTFKHIAALK